MMSLVQLRFFIEVARQKSFSKAAKICCVTQPTLSNSIAQLEVILDGKLFNRSTRQVSLTSFGRHLIPLAEAVLSAQDEFLEGARALKNPQHKLLRIGMSPLINMQLLADILKPFRDQHPEIEVFFKECYLDDLTQRMEDETIDLAIMPKRESLAQFKTLPFYKEKLYFLPCERHDEPEAEHESTPMLLSNIADETIIVTAGGCGLRDAINNLYASEGLSMNEYTGHAVSYKVIEDWAGLGIGAGILPKSKITPANNNVRSLLKNKNTDAMIEYEISYPRNINTASHIHEFTQYLKEVAPQLLQGRAA